jgi:glycosyltransferase involved in cell wall biosynthesis
MREAPDVSVVIPTHNRVSYLQEAVRSSFEGNSSVTIEVIVVNDGSSDGTREYLDHLDDTRVTAVHQSAQGAQVARNTGLDRASGRYVKFLDDDDWLPSGALTDEVERLDTSGADVCHGRLHTHVEETGERCPVQESVREDVVSTIFIEGMWTVPHKYLFRRASIADLSWDPSLPYHQDYAFLIETACRGRTFVFLDRVVGVTRQHEGVRINSAKDKAQRSDYYTLKVSLIKRGIELLDETGHLQSHHRRAAAEGIWNWAHIVAAYDLDAFDAFYEDIQDLVPGFRPPRSRFVFQTLDALLGAKRTEHLLSPVRRMTNESSDVRA